LTPANLSALGLLAFAAVRAVGSASPPEAQETGLAWRDAKDLGLEGRGWTDTTSAYDRLPARAQGVVREPVWFLSRDSAGLCVHFGSDAPEMHVEWTLTRPGLALGNMSQSGASGLDLYVRTEAGWRWMAAARATGREGNSATLFEGLERKLREYLLYLPLYNGVESLRLGIPGFCVLEAMARKAKPVVFYGTSIVQGASASRPGMAYPAVLGRRLDRPVVNLGFAGNGRAEPEVAALVAEIDAAAFVIDPLPNLTAEEVARVDPFVAALRGRHPTVPIVLVECLEYPDGALIPSRKAAYTSANRNLQELFDRLRHSDRRLYLIPGHSLLGEDGEATVDGVHPTDLGVLRLADGIEPVLKAALAGADAGE
jgi:hypothetical protein